MPSPGVTPRDLASAIEDDDDTARKGSGFLAGFATVTVLMLLAVTVYLKHGALAEAVPALAEPLSAYVTVVDKGRDELARLLASIKG